MPITLRPTALRHLTQRKKCDDFWLPGVKSFQTIYNMNDFAVISFSRYYTLNEGKFRSVYVQRHYSPGVASMTMITFL